MLRNYLDKLRLSSLRVRYALATFVLALVLLFVTTMTSYYVDSAREKTSEHILQRKDVLQQTRLVRSAIWDIEKSLQSFLLNPNTPNTIEQLRNNIEISLIATSKLQKAPWVDSLGQNNNLEEFSYSLHLLATSISHLVDTRLDTKKQYPALIYSRNTMLPINQQILTSINLAIDELYEEKNLDKVVQKKLHDIRHLWVQTVSNFRMYLANRLGSFDENVLSAQQQDITQQLRHLSTVLEELNTQSEAGLLGLQTTASVREIRSLLERWETDFGKVIQIHATDKWRADADILRSTINPLFQGLWSRLSQIDIAIESSTDKDINTLDKANHIQTQLLWGVFTTGLLFILFIYFVLDKFLLIPLKNIVSALRAEAYGRQATVLPHANSLETHQLIDAFREMQAQIHRRQNDLEYQALHDSLTGLANRHLLLDRLTQSIQHSRRQDQSMALYILDLDRFKEINDTMGHQVGDDLLKEVALRLMHTLRDTDTIARLGGDEFAIILNDCDEQKATHVANKILTAFEKTYHVNNLHLYLGVSIGIAFYPLHNNSAQGLIQRADIAMYMAKHNKSGYAFYDPQQDIHSVNRLALGSDLRDALDSDNQLMLFYQAKQSLNSGDIYSVEALLRWSHPMHGFIPPAEIIPLAEHTGLIQPLTYWVIETAIQQHLKWLQTNLNLKISVNISAYNLQDKEFLASVQSMLERHNISGDFLTFELTESAMMADPQHAISSIGEFSRLGIKFSIDDFGTGFSSLSYLKQLPAYELKIDKSFILNMTENENDAVIVRSIIELAHNLSLHVTAEGVEDEMTMTILNTLNCDTVQGYHIHRPAHPDEVTQWLTTYTNNLQALHNA